MDNRRFHEIDVLKCVGILTVVYMHSMSTSFDVSNFLCILLRDIFRFAVPGLFFGAGFLFNKNDVSTGQIIKKKMIRILPPYIFCSLCIQFLNLPGLNFTLENLDAKQLIFNLVFGDTLKIYYFIFVLFYLYVFSLFLRLVPDKWVLVIWGVSFLLILFFVKKVNFQGYSFFLLFRHPFIHLFSYITGWVFFLYYEKVTFIFKKHFTAIIFTGIILEIVILAFTRMHGRYFCAFPILAQCHIYICITLLLILGIKTVKYQKTIRYFSNYSYGIYLLHFPIVSSCQRLYPEIAAGYSFPYSLVSWFVGVSISICIIVAIKKITGRYSVHLVGC